VSAFAPEDGVVDHTYAAYGEVTSLGKEYPAELRVRAVWLVAESKAEYESEWAAIGSVAAKLGIGTAETLRK
jgi:transposase-like protein